MSGSDRASTGTHERIEALNGVPARNLSDEEYEQLDTELKAVVRKSGLYDVVSESRTTDTKKGGD